jgi:HPt (histidine-containing phosphotransfer) domain-containing protein
MPATGQSADPAPSGAEAAIDLVHLRRMTFAEERLAREILRLFDRQAEILLARIEGATPSAAAHLAHTLKGSARGIGAWKVAALAEQYELAAQRSDSEALARRLGQLGDAIREAQSAIEILLAAS